MLSLIVITSRRNNNELRREQRFTIPTWLAVITKLTNYYGIEFHFIFSPKLSILKPFSNK